jgi:diguanylate cyclase (GGDEF)-like protein/hemerythrin-like metal-binding protein
MIATTLYMIVFFIIGNPILPWTSLALLGLTALAIWLNPRRPGRASLIYILSMSLHGTFLITQLGVTTGFDFFLFNLAGLIMFTDWKPQWRMLGVFGEIALILIAYAILGTYGIQFELTTAQSVSFLVVNTTINITGIANSVAYFRRLVDTNTSRLIDMTITDPLTQAYNRGYFDVKLDEEITRIGRHSAPLSMISFDLDLFKHINDKHGHPVGDDVLKQLVTVTQRMIRASDLLFRVGGEEFVLLLPETNGAGALVVAHKIQRALRKNVHPIVGRFTASFGIAQLKDGESKNDFYLRADQNLYAAKRNGRDLIMSDDTDILVPLEWDPQWECGHPRIDTQHKNLVELSNATLDASGDELVALTQRLVASVVAHFADEEKILREIGYEATDLHHAMHQAELKKTALLLEKTEVTAKAIFLFVLRDVVVEHMLEEDMEYFPLIKTALMTKAP